MSKALLDLLMQLVNKRIIGGKHRPEKQLLVSKTRWLSAAEKRDFEKGYKAAVNEGLILRLPKRTGKGDEWHISLNPSKLGEIYDLIKGDDEQ